MKKKLNEASAEEWTRASIKWSSNLCPPTTETFDDYVAREKANFFAGADDDFPDNVRPDNVNHPDHYNQGGIECIDYIKQQLGDRFADYCQGNIIKYLHRWRYKNGLEDLEKAQWYLNQMVTAVEEIGD